MFLILDIEHVINKEINVMTKKLFCLLIIKIRIKTKVNIRVNYTFTSISNIFNFTVKWIF